MNRYLTRGGSVISLDPTIGNLDTGDVLIEEGKIAAVFPRIEVADCEVDCGHIARQAEGPSDLRKERIEWQKVKVSA